MCCQSFLLLLAFLEQFKILIFSREWFILFLWKEELQMMGFKYFFFKLEKIVKLTGCLCLLSDWKDGEEWT